MPFAKAFDRKKLLKELERDRRAGRRDAVKKARERLRAARARVIESRKKTAARCNAWRSRWKLAIASAKEATARAREARTDMRSACAIPEEHAALAAAVAESRAALREADELRRFYLDLDRSSSRHARERLAERKAAGRGPATKRELASESDDEVIHNIPAELVPLFHKVKKGIKSSARRSRTEAFLEYVHNSPQEAIEALDEASDRELARLVRERGEQDARELAAVDAEPFTFEQAADDDDYFGRFAVANPCGLRAPDPGKDAMLTELGKLTKLTYRDVKTGRTRALTWGLRTAPVLAYDKRGKLFVLYAPSPLGKAPARAIAEYAKTHWGKTGAGALVAGTIALDPLTELGQGIAITYTTSKGGDGSEQVDYVHAWGEGGPEKFEAPTIAQHVCRGSKCANRDRVALVGGTYRVTTLGIVG